MCVQYIGILTFLRVKGFKGLAGRDRLGKNERLARGRESGGGLGVRGR